MQTNTIKLFTDAEVTLQKAILEKDIQWSTKYLLMDRLQKAILKF